MSGDLKYSSTRPHGHVIIAGPEGVIEGETMQCVHCGRHWVIQPGSGRRRGWCSKCMGPTCGSQQCHECVPAERKLELMEG